MSVEERIKIARRAILELRKEGVDTPKTNFPMGTIAYGCVGILDYIESGDIEKILERNLRLRIQRISFSALKEETQ